MEQMATVLRTKGGEEFVVTPTIDGICKRALSYMNASYAIHLYGPSGTGKTTLAMHIAALRNRPVVLLYGDEGFGTSDMLGKDKGLIYKKVIDNFIHSVLKTDESIRAQWVDERITTACKSGFTLIYDEFSRSRPEANNILLSILEEKILVLPSSYYGETYLRVHPDFRVIFTSNPSEYAGVHKAQEALLDRMVSIKLGAYDRNTQIAITAARSGLESHRAAKIVDIVQAYTRRNGHAPVSTLRASIMIAKIVAHGSLRISHDDAVFLETCADVLATRTVLTAKGDGSEELREIILKHCKGLRKTKNEQNQQPCN